MSDTGSPPTVAATAAALAAAGYRRADDPARGVALLEPAGTDGPDDATGPADGPFDRLRVRGGFRSGTDADRPVEVVATGGDPVDVVTALGNALKRDRDVLFVPEGPDEGRSVDRVLAVLEDPVGAKAVDDDGHRTFYPGPDRVHLDEGGLAAVGTDDLGPGPARSVTFEWFEEPAGDPGDADPGPERAARTGSDRDPRLVLEADGTPVAVVDGVEELACPGPDRGAVPFYYRRGDDRLFHVFRPDGSPVGVFDGVRRMRRQGFVPVPAPLVPEHELPTSPTGRWGVVTGIRATDD